VDEDRKDRGGLIFRDTDARGAREVDVGEVKPDDGERTDFVRRSGLLAYRWLGERGSFEVMCAGVAVAEVLSAFGEQIGWGLV